MTRAEPPLAFSWGYRGWGPYTRELVDAVDLVEASRGFAPPVFVDVRIRRSVRAPGFRDGAFEALLGAARYRWMPDLGNRAILEDVEMQLRDPAAASALLELILDSAKAGRRVIFFCSCASPLKRHECHRGLVATTLLDAAKAARTPLAVQEWPGGAPVIADVSVTADELRKLRHTTKLAVPAALPHAVALALPHFSILRCRAGDDSLCVVSGPAVFGRRGWQLPVHSTSADERALRDELDDDLETYVLAPLGSRIALPKRWQLRRP